MRMGMQQGGKTWGEIVTQKRGGAGVWRYQREVEDDLMGVTSTRKVMEAPAPVRAGEGSRKEQLRASGAWVGMSVQMTLPTGARAAVCSAVVVSPVMVVVCCDGGCRTSPPAGPLVGVREPQDEPAARGDGLRRLRLQRRLLHPQVYA
jgi:hypothetical protein